MPLDLPQARTDRPALRRLPAQLAPPLVLLVGCALLGAGVGLAWARFAPHARETVLEGGGVSYGADASEALFGAEVWFGGLCLAAGVLVTVLLFAFAGFRRAGTLPVLLGLVGGGLLGSGVARWVGQAQGERSYPGAPVGEIVTPGVEVRSLGLLVVWSLAATLLHLALVAGFVPDGPDPALGPPDGRDHR